MARLAAGERPALGVLVRRHQRRVLEIAYRTTGDRALAEDIAQETFLRVWRFARRYKPAAKFSTWLYRIVVNLCVDAFKRRRPISSDVPDAIDRQESGPTLEVEQRERAMAVHRAVRALPVRQRVAVVLHRFSGLTIGAIVESTGWSESSIESLLVRAYGKLRHALTGLEKK